jgi:hypothetical protein
MKVILDRFEGETAVLVPAGGGKPINLPKGVLQQEAAAGDTLELIRGRWIINGGDTEERRTRIAEKARQLFRD